MTANLIREGLLMVSSLFLRLLREGLPCPLVIKPKVFRGRAEITAAEPAKAEMNLRRLIRASFMGAPIVKCDVGHTCSELTTGALPFGRATDPNKQFQWRAGLAENDSSAWQNFGRLRLR